MGFIRVFVLTIVFIFFGAVNIDYCFSTDLSICVVDINMIFQKSYAEKDAKTELEIRQKEMEKILDKMAREISNLSDDRGGETEIINKKFTEKKQRELRIRANDFKALKVKFQEELDFLQKKLISEIEKEIVDIISSVGKIKECKIVINRSSVLYFDEEVDITDEVLGKYNENYAKSKNK